MKCLYCKKRAQCLYARPYCSIKCKLIHLGIKNTCMYCGNKFQAKQEKIQYCSPNCLKESTKQKNKIRAELNGDTEFKKSRFRIFERDNFSCIYCGSSSMDGNNLVVDHVYPVVKGGQNDVFNLVTSCNICNNEKHSRCLSQEQTLAIWERNKSKDFKNGIIKDYNSLKDIFDKKNLHRLKETGQERLN